VVQPSAAEHGRGHLNRCHGGSALAPSSCLMLALPFGLPATTEGENRMAGFLFRLELEGETSADPPTFETAVSDLAPWRHDPARPQRTSRGWYSR
jgi:hypothetical protein